MDVPRLLWQTIKGLSITRCFNARLQGCMIDTQVLIGKQINYCMSVILPRVSKRGQSASCKLRECTSF